MIEQLTSLFSQYKFILKEYLVMIIVSAMLVLLFPIVILPQVKSFVDASFSIKDGEEKLAIIAEKNERLKSLDKAKLDQDVKLVSRALSSEKNFSLMLDTLDRISSQTNVLLGRFSISASGHSGLAVNIKDPVPSLTLSINARGSRDNIKKFLENLSNTLPIARIDKVSLVKEADAVITFSFYYKPLPPTIPSSTTSLPPKGDDDAILQKLSARLPYPLESEEAFPTTSGQSSPSAAPTIFDREDPFF